MRNFLSREKHNLTIVNHNDIVSFSNTIYNMLRNHYYYEWKKRDFHKRDTRYA